jgi:hypothetical protein
MGAVIDWNGVRAECRDNVWTCEDDRILRLLEIFADPDKVPSMSPDYDIAAAERAVEVFPDIRIVHTDPVHITRDPNVVY